MLGDAVLRIALYFDVFGWPLTRAEVARFVRPDEPFAVDAACAALVAEGRLAASGALVFLPGREAGVEKRRKNGRMAERRWACAGTASTSRGSSTGRIAPTTSRLRSRRSIRWGLYCSERSI